MMMDTTSLRQRALEFAESAKLDELKTAAETLKALGDYERAALDTVNQTKMLRSNYWRTFSTAVVPLLTLITLCVTVYFQYAQSRLTASANEDTQWRTVMDTLTKTPTPTSNAAVLSGLIPFYASQRYSVPAYEITFLLVRQLTNITAFRSIFDNAIGAPSWDNVRNITKIARLVREEFIGIDRQFLEMGGPSALELEKTPMALTAIAHQRDEVIEQQNYAAGQMAIILRSPRPNRKLTVKDLQFSDLTFFDVSLEGADFSDLDITGSEFQYVNVAGSVLDPRKFEGTFWKGVRWWEAKSISAPLLKYLIVNAGPYMKDKETYPGETENQRSLTWESYVRIVGGLCHNAAIACDLEHLLFGPPSPTPGAGGKPQQAN